MAYNFYIKIYDKDEANALNKCATDNFRDKRQQIEFYIHRGLVEDGYIKPNFSVVYQQKKAEDGSAVS